jgi:hypothetical protein
MDGQSGLVPLNREQLQQSWLTWKQRQTTAPAEHERIDP